MPRWTFQARAKQAELIKKWKPWKASTGPQTESGKAISSQNALKHGMRSQQAIAIDREINEDLKQLQDFLKQLQQKL